VFHDSTFCLSSLKKERENLKALVVQKFSVTTDAASGTTYIDDVKAVMEYMVQHYNPKGESITMKLVVDKGAERVWVYMQAVNKTEWIDEEVTSLVWALLAYEGAETPEEYQKHKVPDIVNKFFTIKTIAVPEKEIAVKRVLCPDMNSAWALLGISPWASGDSPCPFCDTVDLGKQGASRTSFDAVFDLPKESLVQVMVFCFLHAWLRLCNHRYDMLIRRSKVCDGRRDKAHSLSHLYKLLSELQLQVPRAVDSNPHFVWLKGIDIPKITRG